MDYLLTCPVCKTTFGKPSRFCTECGCKLSEVEAVSVTPIVDKENFVTSLKTQILDLGQKAQKSASEVSSTIIDKASNVSRGTDSAIVQQKVSEAMANLVNMMIYVSEDVKRGLDSEMVKAIDLNARVNFVAFSIGVTVDLASLGQEKK